MAQDYIAHHVHVEPGGGRCRPAGVCRTAAPVLWRERICWTGAGDLATFTRQYNKRAYFVSPATAAF